MRVKQFLSNSEKFRCNAWKMHYMETPENIKFMLDHILTQPWLNKLIISLKSDKPWIIILRSFLSLKEDVQFTSSIVESKVLTLRISIIIKNKSSRCLEKLGLNMNISNIKIFFVLCSVGPVSNCYFIKLLLCVLLISILYYCCHLFHLDHSCMTRALTDAASHDLAYFYLL